MTIVSPGIMELVNADGTPTTPMLIWLDQVSRLQVITGTGSPESVVEALITSQYMDTAGTAGNILYIKRDADIGGDRKQGWILV